MLDIFKFSWAWNQLILQAALAFLGEKFKENHLVLVALLVTELLISVFPVCQLIYHEYILIIPAQVANYRSFR